MSSLFVSVLRQALKTFDRKNQAAFNANLNLLKQMTGQLSVDDVLTDKRDFLTDAYYERSQRAPCIFVNIFENELLSMSVFVLRGNFKMPLHDHPQMYGILRGIYGNLRVQSYTTIAENVERGAGVGVSSDTLIVLNEKPIMVNSATECAILTPFERNFHEITAVEGVAAFFDILSPPYDDNRHCNFYRCISSYASTKNKPVQSNKKNDLKQNDETFLTLQKIEVPDSYYCDTEPTPKIVKQSTRNEFYNSGS